MPILTRTVHNVRAHPIGVTVAAVAWLAVAAAGTRPAAWLPFMLVGLAGVLLTATLVAASLDETIRPARATMHLAAGAAVFSLTILALALIFALAAR